VKLYCDRDFDVFHFGCFWVGGKCESEISEYTVYSASIDPVRALFRDRALAGF